MRASLTQPTGAVANLIGNPVRHRPKILLLTTSFDLSGAERVLVYTARGLAQRGFDVTVAGLRWASGAVPAAVKDTGVKVACIAMRNNADVSAWVRLWFLLRRERFDVVYTFLIHAHVIGRVCAAAVGVPIIISSQQSMGWEGPIAVLLNRWTARWCLRVVAVSRAVENFLAERVHIPREKLTTIYNCVDVDAFRNVPPLNDDPTAREALTVGCAARLAPEKDHQTLLNAFKIVLRTYSGARLLLAGEGPQRPFLEAEAARMGLSSHVEFLGRIEDVPAFFAGIGIYVQASHAEGLPLAVLEAMASARPVIATRLAGNEEALANGEAGILVPRSDPRALADALLRLMGRPEEAARLGSIARGRAEELFSARNMIKATEMLILDLWRKTGSARAEDLPA
jgi:glycosyltransferase involved in cell wall biosynthesis